MSYENHWMRDVEAIIRKERKELVEEFLDDYRSDKRAIIVLNIERNMKAEDHIQYNDIFNKRLDKWNPLERERYAVKDEITGVTNYLKKEKEQTRQTENIKIWEVDPEKLKDVQENYTLVAKEDLIHYKMGLEEIKTLIINNAYVQAQFKISHLIMEMKKYLEEDHE